MSWSNKRLARRARPLRDRLRCGCFAGRQLRRSSWTMDFGRHCVKCLTRYLARRINAGLGIDLVDAKGQRLHRRTKRLTLTSCGKQSEGCTEGCCGTLLRSQTRRAPHSPDNWPASGIATRGDPVEIGVDKIGLALLHKHTGHEISFETNNVASGTNLGLIPVRRGRN